MDFNQFDALAQKVEMAVSVIEDLKRQRDGLRAELDAANNRARELEQALAGRGDELELLKAELESKSANINLAGDKIRDLVHRLDTVLA